MTRLTVLGSANYDLLLQVERLPSPGETLLSPLPLHRGPGGKGANQAVAAARLGATVRFVGAVGNDAGGQQLRDGYASEGIDVSYMVTLSGRSTGLAVITVDGSGQNTIVVVPGANHGLVPEHVERLEFSPDEVLLTQLEVPLETVVAGLERAKMHGATTVLNAAPTPHVITERLRRIMQATDVLVVNEVEAGQLLASRTAEISDDPVERAKSLRRLGPRTVIVTLGPQGCVAAAPDESMRVPAISVEAVDSTGAGDAFCAAVASALGEGRTLVHALELGSAAGALSAQRLGAQNAFGQRSEVDALLAQGGRSV